MTKHEQMRQELQEIADDNNGLLFPVNVIEYAKSEDTALHSCFDWDDSRAAHKYRLEQARQIIRMHVTIIPNADRETRMFVSLTTDRYGSGGYRYMVDVMSDDQMRDELLKEAYQNFKSWQKKYNDLKQLAPVFAAMELVIQENGALLLAPVDAPS